MNWFSVFDIKDAFEVMYNALKLNHPSLTKRLLVDSVNRIFSLLSIYMNRPDVAELELTGSIHELNEEIMLLLSVFIDGETEDVLLMEIYSEMNKVIHLTIPAPMLHQHVLTAVCVSPRGDEMLGFFGEMTKESEKVVNDVFLKLGLKP
jgi:hypothetical protein